MQPQSQTVRTSLLDPLSFPNNVSYGSDTVKLIVKEPVASIDTQSQRPSIKPDCEVKEDLDYVVAEGKRAPQALVVDDDAVMRIVHSKMLVKLGYEVTTSIDGSSGLEALCAQQFDLVISDIQMPNLDGLEMVVLFREWEKEHRVGRSQLVICVSGGDIKYGEEIEKVSEAALAAGMNVFVKKPLSLAILEEQISKLEQSFVPSIEDDYYSSSCPDTPDSEVYWEERAAGRI